MSIPLQRIREWIALGSSNPHSYEPLSQERSSQHNHHHFRELVMEEEAGGMIDGQEENSASDLMDELFDPGTEDGAILFSHEDVLPEHWHEITQFLPFEDQRSLSQCSHKFNRIVNRNDVFGQALDIKQIQQINTMLSQRLDSGMDLRVELNPLHFKDHMKKRRRRRGFHASQDYSKFVMKEVMGRVKELRSCLHQEHLVFKDIRERREQILEGSSLYTYLKVAYGLFMCIVWGLMCLSVMGWTQFWTYVSVWPMMIFVSAYLFIKVIYFSIMVNPIKRFINILRIEGLVRWLESHHRIILLSIDKYELEKLSFFRKEINKDLMLMVLPCFILMAIIQSYEQSGWLLMAFGGVLLGNMVLLLQFYQPSGIENHMITWINYGFLHCMMFVCLTWIQFQLPMSLLCIGLVVVLIGLQLQFNNFMCHRLARIIVFSYWSTGVFLLFVALLKYDGWLRWLPWTWYMAGPCLVSIVLSLMLIKSRGWLRVNFKDELHYLPL